MYHIEDCKSHVYCTFEGTCSLWGKEEIPFTVDIGQRKDKEEALQEYLPIVEQKLKWLEENKRTIEQALIADDVIALAEDWAASADEAEDEEQECYIMEDDQKVFLPISEQDFCSSLQMDSLCIYCDEGKDQVWVDAFLTCSPDYFAGHALNVSIKADGSICNDGLGG